MDGGDGDPPWECGCGFGSPVILVVMQIVLHGHVQQQSDMAVGYPIEHFPALLASLHQPDKPKLA